MSEHQQGDLIGYTRVSTGVPKLKPYSFQPVEMDPRASERRTDALAARRRHRIQRGCRQACRAYWDVDEVGAVTVLVGLTIVVVWPMLIEVPGADDVLEEPPPAHKHDDHDNGGDNKRDSTSDRQAAAL
ncbi:MAG: hypothetical protein ACLP01_28790 [Solirubrobacteraceae bacterium]